MRALIVGSPVCLICLVAALAPARAAPVYPWCAEYDDRGDITCAYESMEQCLATAGGGAGGSCIANPAYHPPVPPAAPRKVKRKR